MVPLHMFSFLSVVGFECQCYSSEGSGEPPTRGGGHHTGLQKLTVLHQQPWEIPLHGYVCVWPDWCIYRKEGVKVGGGGGGGGGREGIRNNYKHGYIGSYG